jgi:MFS family permease
VQLPAGIWVLGFVSMLMDASSELMLSLLPVFMTTLLGASMFSVGIVEGFAEATASIMKLFSGIWSDRFRRRKPMAMIGYGLSALSKPLFPLAASMDMLFLARFTDRVGKGIRGAPRDALIAELAPAEMRGAAFGLRQALDSAGAFIGPLLAVLLMLLFSGDIRRVLWMAVIPAVLCMLLLAAGLREPPRTAGSNGKASFAAILAGLGGMPFPFWLVVLTGATFTMARFSDAFLLLRALGVGIPPAYVPLVLVVMNLVYSGVSYPAGALSDRYGSFLQLAAGILLLAIANMVFAAADRPLTLMAAVVMWGMHLGFTQGVLSKLLAVSAPPESLATGFGIFYLVTGIAVLFSSLLAGALWQLLGPAWTFYAGAIFAVLAAGGLAASWKTISGRAPHA